MMIYLKGLKTVSGSAGESVGCMDAAAKPTGTYSRRLSEALPDTDWTP